MPEHRPWELGRSRPKGSEPGRAPVWQSRLGGRWLARVAPSVERSGRAAEYARWEWALEYPPRPRTPGRQGRLPRSRRRQRRARQFVFSFALHNHREKPVVQPANARKKVHIYRPSQGAIGRRETHFTIFQIGLPTILTAFVPMSRGIITYSGDLSCYYRA